MLVWIDDSSLLQRIIADSLFLVVGILNFFCHWRQLDLCAFFKKVQKISRTGIEPVTDGYQ